MGIGGSERPLARFLSAHARVAPRLIGQPGDGPPGRTVRPHRFLHGAVAHVWSPTSRRVTLPPLTCWATSMGSLTVLVSD